MADPMPTTSPRRGVLLLVVLSVLTLFLLLGMTYVIMAARARSTARAFRNLADSQSQSTTTWWPSLRSAAFQVVRGTKNADSALRFHDLLADKYGGAGTAEEVGKASFVADGQLLRLRLSSGDGSGLCGRVLTFLSAPEGVKGTSTRIVRAALVPGEVLPMTDILVLRPGRLAAADLTSVTEILINGRDFSGTGFNSQAGGPLESDLTDRSLKPNNRLNTFINDPDPLGANEDYDAIDEQNMALASADGTIASFQRERAIDYWIRSYAQQKQLAEGLAADDAKLKNPVIEEELCQALRNQFTNGSGSPTPALAQTLIRLRQSVMRPFPFDHHEDESLLSDFTGRPLNTGDLKQVLYANDVDTDGDGTLDSVWLDLGDRPIRMPDGTEVKPLYAIRCLDLQGRLNLNVHGSPVHALMTDVTDDRLARRRDGQTVAPDKQSPLPVGQGFGAADVRLDLVLNQAATQAALAGSGTTKGGIDGMERSVGAVFGRYGDEVGTPANIPRPGLPNVNDTRVTVSGTLLPRDLWRGPALADTFDFWTRAKQPSRTIFGGSHPDFWSRYATGIDLRGHPLALVGLPNPLAEMVDNPYEFDPSRYSDPHGTVVTLSNAWIDQPFTPAEYEALLRPFNADNSAALPQRMLATMMASAAGTSGEFTKLRDAVTSISWDTPQVIIAGIDAPKWDETRHDWDLVGGLKMDLNRPFGDGIDNDANGIVDDVAEGNRPDENEDTRPPGSDKYAVAILDERGKETGNWHLTRGMIAPSMPEQPGPERATLRARQLHAYHLFNLLKSLADTYAFIYPTPPAPGTPAPEMKDPGSRLFAVAADDLDGSRDARMTPPEARDAAIQQGSGNADQLVARQKEITERVLAQWAVNVVDFLDADAIMTPFRYQSINRNLAPDLHPFTRHVVWGCEFPDLMITETLSFHDRGTADTDKDDGSQKKVTDAAGLDKHHDQVRLPQGSLFVELYATRSPNIPNPPAELYAYQNGSGGASSTWLLDAGRMAPRNVELQLSAPVWRLSIARRPQDDTGANVLRNDPFRIFGKYPDTEWLMPHGGSALGGDTVVEKPGDEKSVVVQPDRYVWFSKQRPPEKQAATIDDDDGYPHIDNTFWIRDNVPSPTVKPGGYLVVGPRASTPLGSVDARKQDAAGATVAQWGVPSPQRITLNASQPTAESPAIGVTMLSGTANPSITAAGNPLPPPEGRAETTATIVAAEPPTGWAKKGVGKSGIGLNVSEPLRDAYYPKEPSEANENNDDVYELYGQASVPDVPFDQDPRCRGSLNGGPTDDRSVPAAPATGTVTNFATVILERLADPARAHDPRPTVSSGTAPNPYWNPYIPVDFQPVDLTIFSGESATDDPNLRPGQDTYFYTRQRGFNADLDRFDTETTLSGSGAIYRNRNPWKPLATINDLDITTVHPQQTKPNQLASSKAYFRHELNQPSGRTADSRWDTIPYHSLGWVNSSYGRRLSSGKDKVPADYDGAPDMPFPSITWNDRPFANAYELLFVPRTAPSRLFTNFRTLDLSGAKGAVVTGTADYASATVPDDLFGGQTPGAHLFPFTSLSDRPVAGGGYSRNADVFGRIFEFVRVPSPFSCTTVAIDPTGWTTDIQDPALVFKAPFNKIPLYREPGGVNLNTIPPPVGDKIWNAIKGAADEPAFSSLADERRLRIKTHDGQTTEIEVPFRSMRGVRHDLTIGVGGANTLFPQGYLTNPDVGPGQRWFMGLTTDLGVKEFPHLDQEFGSRNFTLLGDATTKNASLFAPVLHPADRSSATGPERDPRIHPWFAFQPMVRAASASTVRSETYAIWITLGLFEVQKSPPYTWYQVDPNTNTVRPVAVAEGTPSNNPLYPDGLRLVREYGADTGQVDRFRAFFLYDRSIPVGYIPGDDCNVGQGFLLERFVE
jgi:hypothetical protein